MSRKEESVGYNVAVGEGRGVGGIQFSSRRGESVCGIQCKCQTGQRCVRCNIWAGEM